MYGTFSSGTITEITNLLSAGKTFLDEQDLLDQLLEIQGLSDVDAARISAEVAKERRREPPTITNLELFLTEACPLSCRYCFVHGKTASHAMSPATAATAISLVLAQEPPPTQLAVMFFGGEPFASFPLMKHVTVLAEDLCREAAIPLSFNTTSNGVLLDSEKLQFCRDHRIRILLSIDGTERAHDTFRRFPNGRGSWSTTVRRIPLLRQYQPWIGAKMTVHPDVAEHTFRGVTTLAGLGVNQILLGPATGTDWSAASFEVFSQQWIETVDWYLRMSNERRKCLRLGFIEKCDLSLRKVWGCRAGRSAISVTTDGRIFPCSKMAGVNDLQGVGCLGHVKGGITNLGIRKVLCDIIPAVRPECRKCNERDWCAGGCFATNFEETGDPFLPSRLECEMIHLISRTRETVGQWTSGQKQSPMPNLAEADPLAPASRELSENALPPLLPEPWRRFNV